MSVRDIGREQRRAKDWWAMLTDQQRNRLGDDLVLGEFDWRDWGFTSKPSRVFMNTVDQERMYWEIAS